MAILHRAGVAGRSAGTNTIEIVLTVDGSAVGTIEKTAGGNFLVQTKGLVPALDGLSGASVEHVWAKVIEKVATREVYFTKPITGVRIV